MRKFRIEDVDHRAPVLVDELVVVREVRFAPNASLPFTKIIDERFIVATFVTEQGHLC